jgi:hypothetical protein
MKQEVKKQEVKVCLLFGVECDLVDARSWAQPRPPCHPHHAVALVQPQADQLAALAAVGPSLVATVEELQIVHPASGPHVDLKM